MNTSHSKECCYSIGNYNDMKTILTYMLTSSFFPNYQTSYPRCSTQNKTMHKCFVCWQLFAGDRKSCCKLPQCLLTWTFRATWRTTWNLSLQLAVPSAVAFKKWNLIYQQTTYATLKIVNVHTSVFSRSESVPNLKCFTWQHKLSYHSL